MALQKILSELQISSTELCNLCFQAVEGKEGYFCCNLCNVQRKKSNGFSNLVSHLEDKHINDLKDFINKETSNKSGPLNAFLRPLSKDAKNLHGWIEWIVMGDLPQLFVEDTYTKRYTKLESISRHTLQKYMEEVLHEVQDEITKELPTSFGIMFDGWSCGGEHYIGVYATWVNVSGGVTKILLACGVQDIPTEDDEINEVGFTAEDIGDYLFDVLARYNKGFDAIESSFLVIMHL